MMSRGFVSSVDASRFGLARRLAAALLLLVAARVCGQGVDPGFTVEMWTYPALKSMDGKSWLGSPDYSLAFNVGFVADNQPIGAQRNVPVIRFVDWFCRDDTVDGDVPYPFLPHPLDENGFPTTWGNNEAFIMRATAFLFFPTIDTVFFRLISSDGFQLRMDDVVPIGGFDEFVPIGGFFDLSRSCRSSDFSYTPTHPGFVRMELIQWESEGPAGVAFAQLIDGQPVLINDPDDTRSLRAFQTRAIDTGGQVMLDPAGPIDLAEHESVNLRVAVPSDGQGRAAGDNTVIVASFDPTVADVDASPLTFTVGDLQIRSFTLQSGNAGTTTLQLTNTAGLPVGPDLVVNVHTIESLGLKFDTGTKGGRRGQPSMAFGDTGQIIATGLFGPAGPRDVSDASTGTLYASTDPSVARFNPNGLVTIVTLAGGSTEIIVTHGGVESRQRVAAGAMRNVVLALSNAPMAAGESQQATVLGVFGNAGTRDISATGIIYDTSDPRIATVDANGLITAHEPGVVEITATHPLGPFSDTEPVLVVPARPRLQDRGQPGFVVSVWADIDVGHNTAAVDNFIHSGAAPACTTILPVINIDDTGFETQGFHERIGNNDSVPCLPSSRIGEQFGEHPRIVDNDYWIVHATGFVLIPDRTPIQFGLIHNDGVRFRIDGLTVFESNAWDDYYFPTVEPWTPPRTGLLKFELTMDEGWGTSYLEITQDVGGGEHILLNDPDDTRSLRVFTAGCPEVDVVSHTGIGTILAAATDLYARVDVAIPEVSDGFVTAISSDPNVVGDGDAQFVSFLDLTCGAAALDIVGAGTATLTLSNDMGFGNSPETRRIRIIPIQSLTIEPLGGMGVGDTQAITVIGDFDQPGVGDAGTRDISSEQSGTTYSVSPPNIVQLSPDGVITAIGLGTAQITARNRGESSSQNIVVAEDLTRIAFLVGTSNASDLGASDAAIERHLKTLRVQGLPPKVIRFPDSEFAEQKLDADFDVVLSSSTVQPANLRGRFRCLSIPHVFLAAELNQAGFEGLADSGGTTAGRADLFGNVIGNLVNVFLLDVTHPITQGLDTRTRSGGFLTVFDLPQPIDYACGGACTGFDGGVLAPGAHALADTGFIDSAGNSQAEFTLVVAEAGGLRVDGESVFRGRRVFLGFGEDSFINLTDDGWTLFDQAMDWAASGTRLDPVGTGTLVLTADQVELCPADTVTGQAGAQTQLVTLELAQGGCTINRTGADEGTTYESGDLNVLEVDANGWVSANAPGSATITARRGASTATLDLTVSDAVNDGRPGFTLEVWQNKGSQDNRLGFNADYAATHPPTGIATDIPVINFVDTGCSGDSLDGDTPYPLLDPGNYDELLNPGNNDEFILRATAFLFFPTTDPVSLRVNSDDGFVLTIDGVVPPGAFHDGGRACASTDFVYTPPRTGYLKAELLHWEGSRAAGVEFAQLIGGQPVLINDPVDTRSLRAFQAPCPAPLEEPGEPPALVQIADGLGGINAATGLADTIISPLGEAVAFTRFTLEATEPLVLDGVQPVYTAAGEVPNVALTDDGEGVHSVTLAPAPEPGQWLKLTLRITGKDSGRSAELTIWVAHQPLDVNRDGATNIQDATAFGKEFRGGRSTALIDTNGDGLVNIQDATAFGNTWNGVGTSQAWANTSLPPKP